MKSRFIGGTLIAVIFMLFWLWQVDRASDSADSTQKIPPDFGNSLGETNRPSGPGRSISGNATGNQLFATHVTGHATNSPTSGSGTNPLVAPNNLVTRQNEKAKAWLAQQNGKINFWGQVLDQDDNPLSDVQVVMKVRRWRLGPGGADFPEFVAATDASGRFQFLDASGDTMTIASLTKPGYRLSLEDQRRAMGYQYHNLSVTFVPDPARPEIFHLYREKGAEPMIHYEMSGKIPVDGTSGYFDLRLGKQLPTGGDLQITMVRDPIDIKRVNRKNYYGWRLRFFIPGGGIQVRKDHFGFEAPAGGYLESIEFEQAIDDPQWVAMFESEFYFRTRDGRFGRIKCMIRTDYQPPPCGMLAYGYINPSGSRNLEYDSKNRVMPR